MTKYFLSTSLLAGTIIGAGIFSLPFVFKSAGFSISLIYLLAAATASILIYLMYADIILRTEGDHRFVGYARIYLGRSAFWPSILITIVEMIFVMTIYLILSMSFIGLLTEIGTGLEKLLVFWFLGSVAVFFTLKRIALLEFLITGGIIAIIGVIFALGLPNITNISLSDFSFVSGNLLFPLSLILFALAGRVAIPTLIKYSRNNIKKSIITGVLVPVIVYVLFIFGILALSGQVSEDAITGLVGVVPVWVLWLIGVLGILSLLSSYITVGVDVRRSLALDLRMPRWLRFLIIVGGPLGVYFAGFTSFIGLVSFVGGVFLALEAFFIIFMWLRANKIATQPPVLLKKVTPLTLSFLFVIFGTVLFYEMLKFLI